MPRPSEEAAARIARRRRAGKFSMVCSRPRQRLFGTVGVDRGVVIRLKSMAQPAIGEKAASHRRGRRRGRLA
jgi:hypothetical protein